MGRRRRRASGWLVSTILRFFGISSPAVLVMVLLSYFGVRMPTPDAPADSPEGIAKRAKQIIETVATAKDKIKDRIGALTSKDPAGVVRTPKDDEDLMNVTYQELFDEPEPTKVIPAPAKSGTTTKVAKSPTIPLTPPPDVPKVYDNRDKKRKSGDFPDLNPNPYR